MPRWLPRVLARIHRLAADGKGQFTAKAAEELEASALGLDERDAADVIHNLEAQDSAVVSFHKEQANEEED